MPFFSVVVPTYNRAHMLPETLRYILAQSFTDYEVVVVDDGSTDNTVQVMAQHFGDVGRVRYLRKKNEERSAARNYGLQHAYGQYVVFMDSDDKMHEDHLQQLHARIQRHPECNFFATKFQIDHGKGRISPSYIAHLPEGFYNYRLLLHGSKFNAFVCVRRHNPDLKPFPVEFNMGEDWIFCFLNLLEDEVLLIDKTTITLKDHELRSMADNMKAIEGRLHAMHYLLEVTDLPEKEQQEMYAGGYQFAAIHAYLEGERKLALHFFKKYWNINFKKNYIQDAILFVKIMLGHKALSVLR